MEEEEGDRIGKGEEDDEGRFVGMAIRAAEEDGRFCCVEGLKHSDYSSRMALGIADVLETLESAWLRSFVLNQTVKDERTDFGRSGLCPPSPLEVVLSVPVNRSQPRKSVCRNTPARIERNEVSFKPKGPK